MTESRLLAQLGSLWDFVASSRLGRFLVRALFVVSVGLWIWEFPVLLLAFAVAAVSGAPGLLGALPGIWVRRGRPLVAPGADLRRRRLAWKAFSELYLDAPVDAHDLARIADGLVKSGYRRRELEEILYTEVHPVLVTNLFALAGAWAAFDQDWLEEVILRRSRSRRVAVVFGKWLVSGHLRSIRWIIEEGVSESV